MSTITESLIFSKELDNWRQTHGLTVTALAELLGVSKQMMSDVLSNKKSFSTENLLKAKHILNIYHSMDTKTPQTPDDYAEQNAAILAKYANGKHARLLNFQSGLGLTENDGFLPREGATQPEFAENIAQLIKDGRIDEAKDLLAQMTGAKVRHSTAERATVNQGDGTTRSPVAVVGGSNGQRATWVGTQAFDRNGGVLNVDTKGLIEFCEKDVDALKQREIARSHKLATAPAVELKNKTYYNSDRTDMEMVGNRHNESMLEDEAHYQANLARIEEREARLSRKKFGKGNLEDLKAEYNARRA